jgi:hypothetical protein
MKDFETLLNEGRKFAQLRKEFKLASNPSAGSVGYLISADWIRRYKKYIYYSDLKRNVTPEENNNVEAPGPITNKDFLELEP